METWLKLEEDDSTFKQTLPGGYCDLIPKTQWLHGRGHSPDLQHMDS